MSKTIFGIACLAWLVLTGVSAADETRSVLRGMVKYEPPKGDERVKEQFRLGPHTFAYEQDAPQQSGDSFSVSEVRFPSPVITASELNNTVHCEYFRPQREGKVPAVIVLHILGGDFPLARLFASSFAQSGTAALFLKMPYYGPRRDPKSPRRMISKDPRETVEGMTQAILDIRQATAWLAAREEVDSEKLGVFGISLGGITGALAATAEPRLQNVCLLLAGADVGQVAWETKEMADVRRAWTEKGGTKEEFMQILKNIDPAQYGENVRGRRILMLNAKSDEVIPRSCTDSLWKSFGEPEIVWYNGGHYSVAVHILNALARTTQFFALPQTAVEKK